MGINNDPQTRVLIVGAGIAGLTMGTALRRQLPGFDNFVIYEKANQVGGTWRNNMYPGCSSDVAIHFYSLSTDLNPDWDYSHGFQPQIQSYWEDISKKYDLDRYIIFNTIVCSAVWSSEEELYDIVTEDLMSGERTTTKAKVLITALGILEIPRIPDISGIERFKGIMFHAGRYDSSVELSGRRVAVIGNGASATQMVPMISADPTVDIVEFCRTPNWFISPIRRKFTLLEKWTFRFVPFYMRLYRFACFAACESAYFAIFWSRRLRGVMERASTKYIKMTAPKECIEKLIPSYQMGCRRVIYDTDYLSALHRPNLKLCWDDIDTIVDDGIVTKQGEHFPFDIVIFATGYVTDGFPLHVRGTGMTMKEYYDSHNGPKAYLGTSVPGFPNLCIIGGPNTTTGHISVVFTEEVQVNYIIQLIRPILASRKLSTFDVNPDAADEYNVRIHARLEKSVWATCFSWYRKGRVGKITSIFPGSGTLFWWWLRKVNWSHYDVSGSGKEKNEVVRGSHNWVLWGLVATTTIAVMWYHRSWVLKY